MASKYKNLGKWFSDGYELFQELAAEGFVTMRHRTDRGPGRIVFTANTGEEVNEKLLDAVEKSKIPGSGILTEGEWRLDSPATAIRPKRTVATIRRKGKRVYINTKTGRTVKPKSTDKIIRRVRQKNGFRWRDSRGKYAKNPGL